MLEYKSKSATRTSAMPISTNTALSDVPSMCAARMGQGFCLESVMQRIVLSFTLLFVLREKPLFQFRLLEYPIPDVVPKVFVFRVARISTGFLHRVDHAA